MFEIKVTKKENGCIEIKPNVGYSTYSISEEVALKLAKDVLNAIQPNEENVFLNINYNRIDPWKFLDNMAVNIVTLQACYSTEQPELADKCDQVIDNIIQLKRDISSINI